MCIRDRCKSLRIEKYISFRIKWFFWPPFLSVSPFLLLNLAQRQSYAYAIGLYTRPEIKSWPDIKFCAHAHDRAQKPPDMRTRALVTVFCIPAVQFSKWRRTNQNLTRHNGRCQAAVLALRIFQHRYSQTRSSVPVANELMNSFTEKWFRLLIQ